MQNVFVLFSNKTILQSLYAVFAKHTGIPQESLALIVCLLTACVNPLVNELIGLQRKIWHISCSLIDIYLRPDNYGLVNCFRQLSQLTIVMPPIFSFFFYLKFEPILFPFSGSPGSGHIFDACFIPPSFTVKKKKKNIL